MKNQPDFKLVRITRNVSIRLGRHLDSMTTNLGQRPHCGKYIDTAILEKIQRDQANAAKPSK